MKRSDINRLVESAQQFMAVCRWSLPPNPRWDITDFGLGDWQRFGLVLVTLADEAEYCEKIMYARRGMTTPMHWHLAKKEDISCRVGEVAIRFGGYEGIQIKRNGVPTQVQPSDTVTLQSGERVTLPPGVRHEFVCLSDEFLLGEVSTANNDASDNYFENPQIGRFPEISEDEPPLVRLVSET